MTFSFRLLAFRLLPILGATFVGGGCASTYRFTVDTVRNDETAAELQSFRVVDAIPVGAEAATTFVETAAFVRTALSSKGLFEAPPGLAPDMTIEVDCGVDGAGRQLETVVWERTGDMEEPTTVSTTVYEKFLRVTARAAETGGAVHRTRELWSVYVTNEDESAELAPYVPLLVSAAMDALSENAAGPRELVLHHGDERVEFVERGM